MRVNKFQVRRDFKKLFEEWMYKEVICVDPNTYDPTLYKELYQLSKGILEDRIKRCHFMMDMSVSSDILSYVHKEFLTALDAFTYVPPP